MGKCLVVAAGSVSVPFAKDCECSGLLFVPSSHMQEVLDEIISMFEEVTKVKTEVRKKTKERVVKFVSTDGDEYIALIEVILLESKEASILQSFKFQQVEGNLLRVKVCKREGGRFLRPKFSLVSEKVIVPVREGKKNLAMSEAARRNELPAIIKATEMYLQLAEKIKREHKLLECHVIANGFTSTTTMKYVLHELRNRGAEASAIYVFVFGPERWSDKCKEPGLDYIRKLVFERSAILIWQTERKDSRYVKDIVTMISNGGRVVSQDEHHIELEAALMRYWPGVYVGVLVDGYFNFLDMLETKSLEIPTSIRRESGETGSEVFEIVLTKFDPKAGDYIVVTPLNITSLERVVRIDATDGLSQKILVLKLLEGEPLKKVFNEYFGVKLGDNIQRYNRQILFNCRKELLSKLRILRPQREDFKEVVKAVELRLIMIARLYKQLKETEKAKELEELAKQINIRTLLNTESRREIINKIQNILFEHKNKRVICREC